MYTSLTVHVYSNKHIVELYARIDLLYNLNHSYTQALINSLSYSSCSAKERPTRPFLATSLHIYTYNNKRYVES